MSKSENPNTYIQEANSAETVILQGGLEITRNADGTFYYPDQIAEICNANNISIASLFEAAGGTVQNPTLQENSGQLPTIEAVEGAFPELGIGKKTKSTYDDPRLQDVGDNTYLSRDDLSNPPVRKTRNVTAERPTSQVATELAKNTGGVIVNSSILAFRLAFESGKAARYAYHNTNEFVKDRTSESQRAYAIVGAALIAMYFTVPMVLKQLTPKQKPDIIPTGEFLAPVTGPITSGFGVRTHPVTGVKKSPHGALDIAAPFGAEVKAPFDGTFVYLPHDSKCGRGALLNLSKNTRIGLCHLSKRKASDGEKVEKGEVIAFVGGDKKKDPYGSGSSTGSHLHFKLSKKINGEWTPVDPLENGFYEENGELVNSIPKKPTKVAKK
jgi:murein DD-endopeptidase MepM/ murein hydrolase activator NlpD